LEAVTGPELGPNRLVPQGEGDEVFAPGMLLSLLTYSYATGRFGSDEIEAGLRSDPGLGYLATRRWLPAASFRRFRRRNREVLSLVLARVLAAALRVVTTARDVACFSGPAATVPCPSLLAMGQEEAQRRVERAVLEDSVAADV